MREQVKAIWLLLLATVLWSLSGAVLKVLFAHTELTASAIAGWRALVAGLSLLPFAAWRGGLRVSRLQPAGWMAVAATSFCLMMVTFVTSVSQTTSANAIILMYTAPLWVLLAAPYLTGDHARRRDLYAATISMSGMVIIIVGSLLDRQAGTQISGVLLGVASGLCFAMTSLALRRLRNADAFAVTCLNNLVTAAVLLIVAGSRGGLKVSGWPILALACLGIFQIAIPYAIYCYTLRYLTPQRATLIGLTEPILNPMWVWLVVREAPSTATLIGGAVIIAGVAVIVPSTERGQEEAGTSRVSMDAISDDEMLSPLQSSEEI